jgi:hypothetical protein
MVGVFALPASVPTVTDLLLPLLMRVIEFLLFAILIHQATSIADFDTLLNTWLVLMAVFAAIAELSILRAGYHFVRAARAATCPHRQRSTGTHGNGGTCCHRFQPLITCAFGCPPTAPRSILARGNKVWRRAPSLLGHQESCSCPRRPSCYHGSYLLMGTCLGVS